MRRPDIKTKEDFNLRLKELNSNLEAVSEYNGRNVRIQVLCKACGAIMQHRTPFEWLYNSAKCYYCDNLPFDSEVESYQTYLERKTNGEITPLSEYQDARKLMTYRCNIHDTVFDQYPSALLRKDGHGGGRLCAGCKGRPIAFKKHNPDDLTRQAEELAPNLQFHSKIVSVTKEVTCTCKLCQYSFPTSLNRIKRKRISRHYCPKCNKRIKPDFQEELSSLNRYLTVKSEYKGRYGEVAVICDKCNHIMLHKTPREWLKNSKCYFCDKQPFNPEVEDYNDYVTRITEGEYSAKSENWLGAKKEHLYYCNKHNQEFWQTPDSFIHNGKQCPICTIERNSLWVQERTKSHDQYVRELKIKSPEIEVIGRYRKSTDTIAVRCLCCGHEWAPTAGTLLQQATGCPICAGSLLTSKQFRDRVSSASPALQIIGKYYRGQTSIMVRCKKCKKEWLARKNMLLRGCGCKFCHLSGSSRQELMLLETLKELCHGEEILWRNTQLIGMELDIVIPTRGIAIEIGQYNLHKDRVERDIRKEFECKQNNLRLYTIYFGCGNNPKTEGFERLLWLSADAKKRESIITLVEKCINWVTCCEEWKTVELKINYQKIWGNLYKSYPEFAKRSR